MNTAAACSQGRAAFAVEPTLLSRSAVSDIVVSVTSLPPVDVGLKCSSPYLYPLGYFQVSFAGPENGKPSSFTAHVKLVDSFDANMDSFPLICEVTGSNSTLYQSPRSINVNVAPYQGKGHTSLSGGSVFIIMYVSLTRPLPHTYTHNTPTWMIMIRYDG
jgi:hypothetical protein